MPAAIHILKDFYASIAPHWLRSYVWNAEAVFLDPMLYLVVAGAMLLEWRIPATSRQRRLSVGFWQDVFWFVTNRIIWVGALALLGHGTRLFYDRYLQFLTLEFLSHLPHAVRIVLAILIFDFLDWVRHYVKHKIWWLWAFHAVHHSQREMSLFTDARVHVLEGAINLVLFFIPLSMLKVGIPTDFYIAVVLDWYRMMYHANIRTNYGLLKYILVTPQSHRVHHSNEQQHADMNFGVIFTFWDRLFRTHCNNYDHYPSTGIQDESFPFEQSCRSIGGIAGVWVRQTMYPVLVICRRASTTRSRLVQGLACLPLRLVRGMRSFRAEHGPASS
jgi:sterol desaturase/sphingolipid hydroxylase (fatty acid hydroxylase superfamily)